MTTLHVVSDLHLGVRDLDGDRDEGLASFIRQVTHRDGEEARLVLLGDSFDLVTTGDPGLSRAELLGEILRRHPAPVAALRAHVDAGGRIDVVAGNHDPTLVRGPVRAYLRRALGDERRAVQVHPWMLHVPGLLHAEHGHQYHDLHRFPMQLRDEPSTAAQRSILGAADAGEPVLRLVRAASQAVRAHSASTRREIARYRDGDLARHADEIGMPRELITALDRLGDVPMHRTIARLLTRQVARIRGGTPDAGRQLRLAAAALERLLDAAGHAVPVIVLGHTHVAETTVLPGGATYLNPGTWTDDVRHPHATGADRVSWTTFARIRWEGRRILEARVLRWSGDRPGDPVGPAPARAGRRGRTRVLAGASSPVGGSGR